MSGRRLKQWTLWPEQELYEAIRPLVLFHETAGERAKEIDVPQRTLARKADELEKLSMQSLFSSAEHEKAASPFPERSANSLLTFIMNCLR
jgi:hypothetical protein